MFAIMETGSKQYKVTEGTILDVELIEYPKTKKVSFDKIMLISDDKQFLLGQPYVENAQVKATVLEDIKDDKILVFKYKKKTGYKKTQGHRQNYTRIKVNEIVIEKPASKSVKSDALKKEETKV